MAYPTGSVFVRQFPRCIEIVIPASESRSKPPGEKIVAVGQPVVETAWHGDDQGFVIALAGGTAGELDGSRQRPFDRERMRPSPSEHRERTTLRRRRVGAATGKRTSAWSTPSVRKAGHGKRANPRPMRQAS